MQMVRHIEEEEDADRGNLIDMGILNPTSGNATKRLRMRQETRATKAAEAALKQIASQEFQAEKRKNAGMETDENERGGALATNHQEISRDTNGGDEIIKRVGTRDRGKIRDVRGRSWSSQG